MCNNRHPVINHYCVDETDGVEETDGVDETDGVEETDGVDETDGDHSQRSVIYTGFRSETVVKTRLRD